MLAPRRAALTIEAADGHLTYGAPTKLFDFPPGRRAEKDFRSFDITPDGSRFIAMRTATPGRGRRHINVVLNWHDELEAKVPVNGHSQ